MLHKVKLASCSPFLSLNMVIILVLSALLYGCVITGEQTAKWDQANRTQSKQVALSMGERTFEGDKTTFIKAVINAFANKNLTVINMDKDIGFLVAEGFNVLSPDKEKQLFMDKVLPRLEEFFGTPFEYTPGNYKIKVTVTTSTEGFQATYR